MLVAYRMEYNQMGDAAWKLQWLGWSPWLVGFLVIICGVFVYLQYKKDYQKHRWWIRFTGSSLRMLALLIIGVMLAGPIVTQQRTQNIQPQLTVVLDDSASMYHHDHSMHPSYRFDEIQALDLLGAEQRPRIARSCSQTLQELRKQLLTSINQSRSILSQNNTDTVLSQLQNMHTFFLGQEHISKRLHRIIHMLKQQSQQLSDKQQPNIDDLKRLLNLIDWQLIAALEGLQQQADAALASGADGAASIKQALEEWKNKLRFERAQQFVHSVIQNKLGSDINYNIVSLADPNAVLHVSQTQEAKPHSDFSNCLDVLNRQLVGEQQHSILLLTDGNNNGNKDPSALARSLGARGIPINALLVGDLDEPRDAAIIDLHAPSEMYRADDIPISVRYRIANYPGLEWDLIISINGSEYTRHTVVGTGHEQESSFIISGFPAARLKIEAELKPRPNVQKLQAHTKSWHEDLWLDLQQELSMEDFFQQDPLPPADSNKFINNNEMLHNRHEQFLRRLRSYVTAPKDGWYQFHLSGDDQAYAWLSTDHRPQHKNLIAYLKKPSKRKSWKEQATQNSSFVYLRKDQVYYLEILQREYTHFDHVDIAWTLPNTKKPLLIDDKYLVAYGDSQVAKQLTFRPEQNTENNRREHIIIAHSDPLHLYIIDQYPRWESRLIGTLLQHDEGINIQQHYVGLKNINDKDITQLTQQDVIIIGDVSTSFLNNDLQEHIAEAVRQHGALLIVIAGRHHMPHSFALGPLADILPVQVNASQVDQQQQWRLLSKQNDPLNQSSAINWQWQALPALNWINTQATIKEQARNHIQAQTADGPAVTYCSSVAVGAGRVIYFASDESWRWRQHIGKLAHRKWWRHVLQWGLQSRLHGSDPRLRVAISKRLAHHADEIIVHARFQSEQQQALPQLELHQLDGEQEQWNFTMPSSQHEQCSLNLGQVVDLQPGHYRCSIRHPHVNHLLETREFWIRPQQFAELNDLGTDFDYLNRLCQISGGEAYTFADTDKLFSHLQQRLEPRTKQYAEVFHLWRSWILFGALSALLFCEWFMRKQVGLP